jgi:hypothetical protein
VREESTGGRVVSSHLKVQDNECPPPSFLSTHAEDTGPTTDVHRWSNGTPQNSSGPFGAITLPPVRGIANVHARASNQQTMGKWKAAPPNKVTEPQPPPKPNFGMRIGPHGEMNTQPEGKPTLLMQPQPLADVHPFMPMLKKWRHGIAVDCGPDWSWYVIEAAVEHGPHPTSRTPEAVALFEEILSTSGRPAFAR